MIVRFSKALGVSADELLGLAQSGTAKNGASIKLVRRMKQIEALPAAQQKILLRTIDTFLKGAQK